jgi:hypothetical protein
MVAWEMPTFFNAGAALWLFFGAFLFQRWDSSKRGKPSLELLFSGTVKVMQEEKGCGRPQQRQVKREGRKEPDE